ncbi:DUF4913 domain-containing protein [Nocardia terpenica]|uniref:DUF4913 domain-containing protein n=2 Tax=Nocardia terpenica TaxID=455432 RepID=A0A6G9ZHE8_9NOCA|nr:DUF4913 domain-containing protein [Nocardia terpenica]
MLLELADRKYVEALAAASDGEATRVFEDLAGEVASARIKGLRTGNGGPTGQLKFANLREFCTKLLFEIFARDVADSSVHKWCPEWWKHPEAWVRLEAVWRAFERMTRDGGTGVGLWLIQHADPQMAKLFDPEGTFKYCDGVRGHEYSGTAIPPLPHRDPPEELKNLFRTGEVDEPPSQPSGATGGAEHTAAQGAQATDEASDEVEDS